MVEAYIFANKNVYFLKIDNAYYCYLDIGEIAKITIKRSLIEIITDKMPEGITEKEGGMRLLSNQEIRGLKVLLEHTNG
jgi:hypothetical protein